MGNSKKIRRFKRALAGSSLVLSACVGAPIQAGVDPNGITNASATLSNRSVVSIKTGASRGEPKSMYLMAMLHIEGNIPGADYDEGIRWLKKSAAKGNRDAQRLFAFMENAFSGEGC